MDERLAAKVPGERAGYPYGARPPPCHTPVGATAPPWGAVTPTVFCFFCFFCFCFYFALGGVVFLAAGLRTGAFFAGAAGALLAGLAALGAGFGAGAAFAGP